jgi:hypothetical protein
VIKEPFSVLTCVPLELLLCGCRDLGVYHSYNYYYNGIKDQHGERVPRQGARSGFHTESERRSQQAAETGDFGRRQAREGKYVDHASGLGKAPVWGQDGQKTLLGEFG